MYVPVSPDLRSGGGSGQVPHINVCHIGSADTDTGVWSSDPDTQDTSAMVSASAVFTRQSTLESPCYQPSPHHRHPYHSVPSQLSPSPPASPRDNQSSNNRPNQIITNLDWTTLGSSTDSSRHLARSSTEESHGSRVFTRSSTEDSHVSCGCRSDHVARVTFAPVHVSPLSSPDGDDVSDTIQTICSAPSQFSITQPNDNSDS